MNIGTQIQTLRREHNITQETLAAEMGVTVGAVSKWENNATMPDILMLCSLADYFQVTTDELLGRTHKESFVVCDDAAFLQNTLKKLLEKEGYPCMGLVESGTQLRSILDKNIPDILFLDIHLGSENGLELLQEVKCRNLPTKVIIITADHSEECRQSAISYGADAYVTKPFTEKHILHTLETLYL
ncbi:MAG: response regulator [Lachnospiraceae bacterium]|nr:response regulator [Lachnospiraceae bacterium]